MVFDGFGDIDGNHAFPSGIGWLFDLIPGAMQLRWVYAESIFDLPATAQVAQIDKDGTYAVFTRNRWSVSFKRLHPYRLVQRNDLPWIIKVKVVLRCLHRF